MEKLSATSCHLTLGCVFAFLTGCGCSPSVDRAAITKKICKTDPQVKRFLEIFPNADVSLKTRRAFGQVYQDPRNQKFQVRHDLTDGHGVMMSRGLRVESDGVTFNLSEGGSWQYHLAVANAAILPLDEAAFDALLAARGDLNSLKPHGMDFSLAPMEAKKVIGEVRRLYPPAGQLHKVFPDAWTQVDKPVLKQRGRFNAVANLADGVQLSVRHEVRVAANGIGVELIGEPIA